METEFIFWRHNTSPGIKIEEISGGEDKSGKIWKAMALQVFGENGGERYREIDHSSIGAPLLEGVQQRISISHTPHFWVIALLPRTPESDLQKFSVRTAMGIDAERADRTQVLKVAERVMSAEEIEIVKDYALKMTEVGIEQNIDNANIKAFVLAWTIKEALYKAALQEGLDYKGDLKIISLPQICTFPTQKVSKYGKGIIRRKKDYIGESANNANGQEVKEFEEIEMELYCYESEGHIITLAYSPKCAKFHKE